MSDEMKQAWDEVGEGFAALGRLIREQYKGGDDSRSEGTEALSDDVAAESTGSDRRGGPTSQALKDALDKLSSAVRDLGERASDVVESDEVKEQARLAGRALNNALSRTVDMVVAEAGEKLPWKKGAKASASTPAAASDADRPPTADEVRAADRAAGAVDVTPVGEHAEEMNDRGADVRGEGQIEPE